MVQVCEAAGNDATGRPAAADDDIELAWSVSGVLEIDRRLFLELA
jgi:hypothetical protein